MIKLSKIKPNPNNPRLIKDDSFKRLCDNIKSLPKMMALRPIVVNDKNIIMGGNMRLRALQELGYTEIPEDWVRKASDFTSDELRQFIILDNISFGEWNWDDLANEWNQEELIEWGLEIPGISNKTKTVEFEVNSGKKYEVIAECKDESEQDKVHDLLLNNGYKCRVV